MRGTAIAIREDKPATGTTVTDVAAHDTGRDEEQFAAEGHVDSGSPPADGSSARYKDSSSSSRGGSQSHSTPDTQLPSQQPQLENGFYIEIPHISDKENYEHLPGYSTVLKILREVKPGHYLAKLGSGEVDLVSVSPLY